LQTAIALIDRAFVCFSVSRGIVVVNFICRGFRDKIAKPLTGLIVTRAIGVMEYGLMQEKAALDIGRLAVGCDGMREGRCLLHAAQL